MLQNFCTKWRVDEALSSLGCLQGAGAGSETCRAPSQYKLSRDPVVL